MATRLYAVCIDGPDDDDTDAEEIAKDVESRLADRFGSHNYHRHSSSLFLVATNDLTDDVCKAAGIEDAESPQTGVVFRLHQMRAGYTFKRLWDWLSDLDIQV